MTNTNTLPVYFQHLLEGVLARVDGSKDNGYRAAMINQAIAHVERMANKLTDWAMDDRPGAYPLPRGVDAFALNEMLGILYSELDKIRAEAIASIHQAESAFPLTNINVTAIVIGIVGIGSYVASIGTVLAIIF